MSFPRRKSKVKSIRSDSKLDFQKGLDASREGITPEIKARPKELREVTEAQAKVISLIVALFGGLFTFIPLSIFLGLSFIDIMVSIITVFVLYPVTLNLMKKQGNVIPSTKDRKTKMSRTSHGSRLDLQKGLDDSRVESSSQGESRPFVESRPKISLDHQITRFEEEINTPQTRSTPPSHITLLRKLATAYMKKGDREDPSFYPKAENLYKQFSVLYPLHMEKIDWVAWIEASGKAKLIREARNLLAEARLLFPGDEELDEVETKVLHIDHTRIDESA